LFWGEGAWRLRSQVRTLRHYVDIFHSAARTGSAASALTLFLWRCPGFSAILHPYVTLLPHCIRGLPAARDGGISQRRSTPCTWPGRSPVQSQLGDGNRRYGRASLQWRRPLPEKAGRDWRRRNNREGREEL